MSTKPITTNPRLIAAKTTSNKAWGKFLNARNDSFRWEAGSQSLSNDILHLTWKFNKLSVYSAEGEDVAVALEAVKEELHDTQNEMKVQLRKVLELHEVEVKARIAHGVTYDELIRVEKAEGVDHDSYYID